MGILHARTVGIKRLMFKCCKGSGIIKGADSIRHLPNTDITVFTGTGRMKKIYCSCGRIIGLDSSQMNLKLKLGKDLECTECRNARISRDIADLNAHFDGTEEESTY